MIYKVILITHRYKILFNKLFTLSSVSLITRAYNKYFKTVYEYTNHSRYKILFKSLGTRRKFNKKKYFFSNLYHGTKSYDIYKY